MPDDAPAASPVPPPSGVHPGYAHWQLAKAFTTATTHPDPATRARAQARIAAWTRVIQGLEQGTLAIGSRTPRRGTPLWVTLQVRTGGFTTGARLAGGPVQAHERALLAPLPPVPEVAVRRVLNSYYLTEAGLAALQAMLESGCYQINVPEEGALLVVAALVQAGQEPAAQDLLAILEPWWAELRFYPVLIAQPRLAGAQVFVQDVGSTLTSLQQLRPNPQILAQREAVTVWTPLYDRLIALFLETVTGAPPTLQADAAGRWVHGANGAFPVQGGWPCQHYPAGWATRATALLQECKQALAQHHQCRKPQRAGTPFAELHGYLRRCVADPARLRGREVGRIRVILAGYLTRRGAPGSAAWQARRAPQVGPASAPTFQEIAAALAPRLQPYPPAEGLADLAPVLHPITADEAARSGVPASTQVPLVIQARVERCLSATVDVLVARGLVTSGSTIARLLPQISAGVRAASFADPAWGRLFAALYTAFRRRRSLLLLNLQKQVQIEELPWVAALMQGQKTALSAQELARQTLRDVSLLTIASFPYAILPNKLLQELRALAATAALDLPLVEELAADIFMGQFSEKFVAAARQTATVVDGTLYATYYGLDYAAVQALPDPQPGARPAPHRRGPDPFARLCMAQASVAGDTWSVAGNGMIIEQQQILTTQNLAPLFAALDLPTVLGDQLADLPRHCFRWIGQRLQILPPDWHTGLIHIKNSAYAWRQLIFFLALLPALAVDDFLTWAESHLQQQPAAFQERFRPALTGLILSAQGHAPDSALAVQAGARRFLGWTTTHHWLQVAPAAP